MLPFYATAVEQLLDHDGLCVLAEGLGLHKLLSAFVRLHTAQGGGLVLLLGCMDWQKRALLQELASDADDARPPADVTADMSIAERLAHYAAGGCVFVTTRILVVDLLTERLPPAAISGARPGARSGGAAADASLVRLSCRQRAPRDRHVRRGVCRALAAQRRQRRRVCARLQRPAGRAVSRLLHA
jgi:hypothetical protein